MKDIRIANLEDEVKRTSNAVMKAESERDRLEEARMTLATQYGENERQLHRAIEKLKTRTKEAEANAERYRIERADYKAQVALAREVALARRKSLVTLLSDVRWLMDRSGLNIQTEHAEKAIELFPDRKIPEDVETLVENDVTEVESA